MTPLTKNQWKSVLLNSAFAFLSAFLPVIVYSTNLDKAAISGALVAGFMAAFKVLEKLGTEEKQ